MSEESYTLFREALHYARGPFSYEHIAERIDPTTRYRIRDARDDAVGLAGTPEDAQRAVDQLNRDWFR